MNAWKMTLVSQKWMNRAYQSLLISFKRVDLPLQEEAFGDEWREKSILEDLWKAETYLKTYQKLRQERIHAKAHAFRGSRRKASSKHGSKHDQTSNSLLYTMARGLT